MASLPIPELEEISRAAILTYGYSDDEAEVILETLLYAQLRGNNQGIAKLIDGGIPKDPQAGEIRPIKETEFSVLLDGARNMGIVVMHKAIEIALQKGLERGVGIVGTHNTSSSTGAIGYYVSKIAQSGFIGFCFSRTPERVSAYGSYEPIFGTNPLAVGIPTGGVPIVFDMSTAAISYYGLVEAKVSGREIPPDVALDAKGNPTNNPAIALEGAVLPFDRSYKGAGLAMIIEILAGPLVGASHGGAEDSATNWGNLILALSPDLLVQRDSFEASVRGLLENVRKTKRLPEIESIFSPGERGNMLAEARTQLGVIEIDDKLLQRLREVIDR